MEEVFQLIGGLLMLALIIAVVITAVIAIICFGSVIGFGVGFNNYAQSFISNVKLERPTS